VSTEIEVPVPPATSGSFLSRARDQLGGWWENPNPVWVRELRQSARLSRTPVVLAVLTVMVTLLISSIGGMASVSARPAKVGVALFHTFFSLAFLVVTWLGPAVAASTISSERSGRTWEALLLTGIGPSAIARGKFFAALSYLSLYVVMLAPVGALPFLFGGVTATEVAAAFLLLLLFGALSVAFGLAVSSRFWNQAAAIIVTLIVAIPLSLTGYIVLGPVLSIAVNGVWPVVPAGPPVWLPTAYVRADFGFRYFVLLVAAPAFSLLGPVWLLYELTKANLKDTSDDRSTGVRIWFVATTPLLIAMLSSVAWLSAGAEWFAASVGAFFVYLIGVAVLFAGEPLGPSRRVAVHWTREGVGRLQRFLGPGLTRANTLLAVFGLLGFALLAAAAHVWAEVASGTRAQALGVGAVSAHLAAFFVFLVGLATWLRSRSSAAGPPRLLVLAAVFVFGVGPWIAMAIAGVLAKTDSALLMLAAPSPAYAAVLYEKVAVGTLTSHAGIVPAAVISGALLVLSGLGLSLLGKLRIQRRVSEERRWVEHWETTFATEPAPGPDAPAP
jgi:ABC-type transport system involved in multi-copper enzyme maturation permease subunit